MTLASTSARPGPVSDRVRALVLPGAVGVAVAAGTAYVALVDPSEPGHYPLCPTYAISGIYCPGCGLLRASHELVTLDVAASVAFNPLALPLYLGCAVLFVRWVLARWQGRTLRWDPPTWMPWALAVAFVVFTVARNVPGWAWLSPA
ncbi:DUF2752 domain-containing protein [Fodinibacter luteus]|uniref:DUF2752 domain-containing protein n=1 Tax=Fodinibacter luteus TaxID=552064 RepID=A0ABP8KNB1_9MICO